eukprot:TRINITY_DN9003_c0_g1_i1.p1 TRINITY_DN9003_c0_g1~~TRINITY_DN9003_c0_g1_i1.p1  ORF type:complete len:292 (-),score=35.82 TRINITY_DN9003_c0_g1_i1:312-1187(-)
MERTGRFRALAVENEVEGWVLSDAVVDASGTYGNPNSSGPGGVSALGEAAAIMSGRVFRGCVPDPLGADRCQFEQAGRVCVLGSGYSAMTTLNSLVRLGEELKAAGKRPHEVIWLTRRTGQPYVRIPDDPLPQRDLLAHQGNRWAEGGDPHVLHLGGAQLLEMRANPGGLTLTVTRDGEEERIETDLLVSHCGFRPDNSLYQELQIHQCYATEGPMKLAAAMMAGSAGMLTHDCLQQVAPGAQTLTNPEPGFLILGMKSYGRGSKFIMKIGHAQVTHAVELLDQFRSREQL